MMSINCWSIQNVPREWCLYFGACVKDYPVEDSHWSYIDLAIAR